MTKAKQPGEFRKIDIYAKSPVSPRYLTSTRWAKNLREARENYALGGYNDGGYGASDLIACYSDKD